MVEGDTHSQFASLISRLEMLKLYDSRTRILIRLTPIHIQVNETQTFGFRFRGYSIVPGTSIGLRTSESAVTIIDAAHLTNPETRGVMFLSTVYGADREIHLKFLTV